ncbi:MAG TPA: hypothetical protein VIC02_07305, partial [Kineobactrum sp.]
MTRLHIHTLLFTSVLLGVQVLADAGAPTEVEATVEPAVRELEADAAVRAEQQQQLRQSITALESEYGAYGPALPERLLSLGLSLQEQGRHSDAIAVFKRGTHLARVTSGLYSAEQIPLLQSELASLAALGDHHTADQRQNYLYRVQMRALGDPGKRT